MFPGYYKNKVILYLMMPYLKNREFALLPAKGTEGHPMRYLRAHNVQSIRYWMERMGIYKGKRYSLYMSNAKYKNGVPYRDPSIEKGYSDEWRKSHWKSIESYDLVIDLDSDGNLRECHKDMSYIRRFLNMVKCPHFVRFSGRGFHFIVPDSAFPKKKSYDPTEKGSVYDAYRQIASFMLENLSPLIDMSIYDSKRLIKVPYSLALYGDYEETVCSPLANDGGDRLFNSKGTANLLLKETGITW